MTLVAGSTWQLQWTVTNARPYLAAISTAVSTSPTYQRRPVGTVEHEGRLAIAHACAAEITDGLQARSKLSRPEPVKYPRCSADGYQPPAGPGVGSPRREIADRVPGPFPAACRRAKRCERSAVERQGRMPAIGRADKPHPLAGRPPSDASPGRSSLACLDGARPSLGAGAMLRPLSGRRSAPARRVPAAAEPSRCWRCGTASDFRRLDIFRRCTVGQQHIMRREFDVIELNLLRLIVPEDRAMVDQETPAPPRETEAGSQ
jgi:hypothetical protein